MNLGCDPRLSNVCRKGARPSICCLDTGLCLDGGKSASLVLPQTGPRAFLCNPHLLFLLPSMWQAPQLGPSFEGRVGAAEAWLPS